MTDERIGGQAFAAGAIGLIAGGVFHSLAVLGALLGEPTNEADAAYRNAAKAFELLPPPLGTTMWDAAQILSASYSVLIIQVGVLNLVVMRAMHAQGQLARLTWLNVVFVTLLLAIGAAVLFPPPIIFAGFSLACFAFSLRQQIRATAE